MEKIFYADNSAPIPSHTIIKKILAEHFSIFDAKIERTESGKPYLVNTDAPLFFSVTHTKKMLFIVFSEKNVGADAELYNRKVHYQNILRRFPVEERAEIDSMQKFLLHWTVKESAIKWLGGTIARDLELLSFASNQLQYKQKELPVHITTTTFQGHILSICCERDFSNAPFIYYNILNK